MTFEQIFGLVVAAATVLMLAWKAGKIIAGINDVTPSLRY